MPRAPCCDEKLKLKKGPWTREEDQILINYVQTYGHPNWRALPKQAGLLRCGKSCRLRWINYLRPDIKRGNYSPQEEDTILRLHQLLGNRWSAIAAKLPGRTDNEIKNVWHTHLKKRLNKNQSQNHVTPEEGAKPAQEPTCSDLENNIANNNAASQSSSAAEPNYESDAPQQSCSGSEYSSENACLVKDHEIMSMDMFDSFPEIDDSFWTDAWSDHNDNNNNVGRDGSGLFYAADGTTDDHKDFWYNVLLQAQDDLPLIQ